MMERLSSRDSLENNQGYREFECSLEGLDEELGLKKRRLSVDQVKALEKNFEVENKLEPQRKLKLAQALGLQVAIWFQNRRARWKTKQLERGYGVLKANYDSLKHTFDSLKDRNESLHKEIRELKSMLHENNESDHKMTKEEMALENNERMIEELVSNVELIDSVAQCDEFIEMNFTNNSEEDAVRIAPAVSIFFLDLKDGSSDSDSSAILNEDNMNSPNAAISCDTAGIFGHQFMPDSCFQSALESNTIIGEAQKIYHPQFVKIEEHNFFGHEDDSSCNIFSGDQDPSSQWYSHDHWN